METTISVHRKQIGQRLRLGNRFELARFAGDSPGLCHVLGGENNHFCLVVAFCRHAVLVIGGFGIFGQHGQQVVVERDSEALHATEDCGTYRQHHEGYCNGLGELAAVFPWFCGNGWCV